MDAAAILAPTIGIVSSCQALGLARSSFYRQTRSSARVDDLLAVVTPVRVSPRALDATERQAVLDVLHSPRFQDRSPTEVYATLLDEGVYLASERTFYRLLAASGETTERRDQLSHPAYAKPELLVTRPNEVWSWDITKLLGPTKWTYYYLYGAIRCFERRSISRMRRGWLSRTTPMRGETDHSTTACST